MSKPFYITTPIYYVNDVPHIGTAYTTVAADVLARYRRLRGEEVFFLTGTDEHGQKVADTAESKGFSPQQWADQTVTAFIDAWRELDVSNDDFIRTTEDRHTVAVQTFLRKLHDQGDIYLGHYEGWYCVGCEDYYLEDALAEGRTCPVHGRVVEWLSQDNYFFRLSAYAERLIEHYETHPDFVRPEERRNEMLSFIRGGLNDFSISRTSFTWGIPLPWDPQHVTYVWFEALINYLTAVGFGADPERFARIWPAEYHFVGKDILRFHSVTWPAMLMAAGLELPGCIQAHGWLLVGGEKMSKSKANQIHPRTLVEDFGVDAYRYYFLRELSFGQDGSFSYEGMVNRYNADLANDYGNLASRVTNMVERYCDGVLPAGEAGGEAEDVLAGVLAEAVAGIDREMGELAYDRALGALWSLVRATNRYVEDQAPWALAKRQETARLHTVLYSASEALRAIAVLVSPWMPRTSARLWEMLGMAEPLEAQRLPEAAAWGRCVPGQRVSKGEPLFPRMEVTK